MNKPLQETIGYVFKNEDLLKEAMTHSSYANESPQREYRCNERLEFLGDAVLEIIVSEWVYKMSPEMNEGKMTSMRSKLVCEASLAQAAKAIELGNFIRFGRGENLNGGRNKESILADAFEALVGAVFLDGGLSEAQAVCGNLLRDKLGKGNGAAFTNDYKTYLQEYTQKEGRSSVTYEICMQKGPDHDKFFGVNAIHNKTVIGYGEGKSKKDAEQNAARDAVKKYCR